jgi:hypothetical protein
LELFSAVGLRIVVLAKTIVQANLQGQLDRTVTLLKRIYFIKALHQNSEFLTLAAAEPY